MSSALLQWEQDTTSRWRRVMTEIWNGARRPVVGTALCLAGFAAGVHVASQPGSPLVNPELRNRLVEAEATLAATRGELELVQLELNRLHTVMDRSARHGIPANLAASIYDIALSEGIEPSLAYRLVHVESGFTKRAISHKGAVGLTQLMPRTAMGMRPGLTYRDLFNTETNLRIGFRYLTLMLDRYDGDMRLALLAYNRGPGTVDGVLSRGGDPANGYARAVMNGQ